MNSTRQHSIILFIIPLVVIFLAVGVVRDIEISFLFAALCSTLILFMLTHTTTPLKWAAVIATAFIILIIDHFRITSVIVIPAVVLPAVLFTPALRRSGEDDYYYVSFGLFLGLVLLLFVLSSLVHGNSPGDRVRTIFSDINAKTQEKIDLIYPDAAGFSEEEFTEIMRLLEYLIVGSFFVVYLMIFYFAGRSIRKKASMYFHPPAPFILLRVREKYVFVLIFSIALEIIGRITHIHHLFYISRSTLLVIGAYYFVVGISLVVYLLILPPTPERKSLPMIFKVGLVVLVVLSPHVCAFLGILDMWFNFRRLPDIREA